MFVPNVRFKPAHSTSAEAPSLESLDETPNETATKTLAELERTELEQTALSDGFEVAQQLSARLLSFLDNSNFIEQADCAQFEESCLQLFQTFRALSQYYQAHVADAPASASAQTFYHTLAEFSQTLLTIAQIFKTRAKGSTSQLTSAESSGTTDMVGMAATTKAITSTIDTTATAEAPTSTDSTSEPASAAELTFDFPAELNPAKLQDYGAKLLQLAETSSLLLTGVAELFMSQAPQTPEQFAESGKSKSPKPLAHLEKSDSSNQPKSQDASAKSEATPDRSEKASTSPAAFLYAKVCNFYDSWKNFDHPSPTSWTGNELSAGLERAKAALGFRGNKSGSNEWGSAFIRASSQALYAQAEQSDHEAELRQAYWQALNQTKITYKTAREYSKAFRAALHDEAINTLDVLVTLMASGNLESLPFVNQLDGLSPAQFLAEADSATLQTFLNSAQTALQVKFPAVAGLIPQTETKLLTELAQSNVAFADLEQNLETYRLSFFRYLFFLASERMNILEQIIHDDPQLAVQTTRVFFGDQTATELAALLPA